MAELLEVSGLTKRFGGLVAVNDVSFSVREREILSVIGPNGAGKSTLFKLISSFLRPTSGEVRFRGERISGPGAAHRCPQGRRAHVPGDDDLQEHERARQRHHRPPSALEGEPARLLPRHRRWPRPTRPPSAARPTRSSSFSACRRLPTRSPGTCRMAICARSASPSASPPTRRSCCSTSLSPA